MDAVSLSAQRLCRQIATVHNRFYFAILHISSHLFFLYHSSDWTLNATLSLFFKFRVRQGGRHPNNPILNGLVHLLGCASDERARIQ
jgi:hypothetical protein